MIAQELITPEQAKIMLASNIENNRCVRSATVAQYANDMLNGEWEYNGETIKFGEDGDLLDGQHRLLAIIRSGISIKIDIVRNLKKTAFKTIDRGRSRSIGDIFRTEGEQHYAQLAAAINWLARWKNRNPIPKARGGASMSANDAMVLLEEHPNIRDSVHYVTRRQGMLKNLCAPSVVSFACYLFSEKSRKDAELFVYRLCNGNDLSMNHPILVTRHRMINMKNARMIFPDYEYLALLILAWNNVRRGTIEIKRASWDEKRGLFPSPK